MSLPQVVTTDENNSYRLSKTQVWIMPAVAADPALGRSAGYTYPWDWGLWKVEKRLIPKKATRTVGSMGSADFQLLRALRRDEKDNATRTGTDLVVEGSWIAITFAGQGEISALASDPTDTTPNPRQVLDPARIIWFGYLSVVTGDVLKGTAELIGSATAREVGALLDRQQIVGWQRSKDDSVESYGDVLTNPPTANLATGTSTIIGNAVQGKTFDDNHAIVWYFARIPATCSTNSGNIWSRDRLLQHIVRLCPPLGLPELEVSYDQAAIQSYLDVTTPAEVFELRNLTYKGALDLLVAQVRGLGWYITAEGPSTGGVRGRQGRWMIHLFSYAESNAYGLPPNNPADVQLGALTADDVNQPVDNVSFTFSQEDVPDEVIIEGNPCIFAGTVSDADGNQINAWTDLQESSYLAGAKLNLDGSSNATAYNALGDDDRKTLNAAVREQSSLRDVFTRFLLQTNQLHGAGDLSVANPPGLGTGPLVPLCPTLHWTGGTLQATTESSPAYLPAARVLRVIPWAEGVKSDGTDTRDAKSKAAPQFLTLRVFRYDKTLSLPWRDQVAQNGRPALPSLSVEPDDHGPGVRIRFSPPEVLAAGHWSNSAAIADINPDASAIAFDWKQLVVTLAVEGDQRVRVAKRRQVASGSSTRDLTDTEVRTRLVIPAPDLHCWVVAPKTILGLLASGQPDHLTADNLGLGYHATRNDFPVAEMRAKMAAAFAFRKRAACTISRARPDRLPPWARIGYMIGNVRDTVASGASVPVPSNTVVTSISFGFGDQARVSVSTDLPTMPSFPALAGGGLGGGGPSGGGAVSTSLSGTTSQAVSRVAGQGALATDRDTQRLPVIYPRGGASAPPLVLLEIIDGQTVYNVGGTTYYGILNGGSIASVPSLYDPTGSATPGAFTAIDGIGRAYIYRDGVRDANPVLVVLDSRSPVPNPLITGDVVMAATPVSIIVGSGPDHISAYVPQFQ